MKRQLSESDLSAIDLIHWVCAIAGDVDYLRTLRTEAAQARLPAAVRHHDSPALFDWFVRMASYQGICDTAARVFMEKHGAAGWHDRDDAETTCLDSTKDEIIELGMVKFAYSDADEIIHILEVFQSLHQPAVPIPPEVTTITGITEAMVAGHRIDHEAVAAFVADANIVIAHNAGFDRKFAERLWPTFVDKPGPA